MYQKPSPYVAPVSVDETFTCSADIVKELKRLHRPSMAKWVEQFDEKLAAANRRADGYFRDLVALQQQLPQYHREKEFDPRPPAEASD
jgi:hypothetical protein